MVWGLLTFGILSGCGCRLQDPKSSCLIRNSSAVVSLSAMDLGLTRQADERVNILPL